ncbi:MAG: hypothetical protein K2X11_03745 [Acetobacteraceae bacterium]|nr:hypothetical protein [Acetobacteraceae bacterium]
MSRHLTSTPFLRFALLADAGASAATGLLLAAAFGPLSRLMALPEGLLFWAGLAFLPWAAGVAWLAGRPAPSRRAVRAVAILNLVYVADSLLLLGFGTELGLRPNGLGAGFVLLLAAAVAGFAAMQWAAQRQAAPSPAMA